MCKISVIIPAYNAEGSLAKTVGTVLNNTVSNWEMILVDDGSADGTAQVCRALEKRDPRIRCVQQEHGGVSSARNRGLDLAQGEFIAFLDADDTVTPDYLQKLLDAACEDEADWVACSHREVFVQGEERQEVGFPLVYPTTCVLRGDALPEEAIRDIFCGNQGANMFSVCCGLYRRSMIEEGGLRMNEEIAYGEDVLFNFEVAHRAKCVVYLPERLYGYTQHEQSSSRRLYREGLMDEDFHLLEVLDQKMAERGEVWDDALLSYAVARVFEIVRFAILPVEEKAKQREAFHELHRRLHSGRMGEIWKQTRLRHVVVPPGRPFLILLKAHMYRLISASWDLADDLIIKNNQRARRRQR